MVRKIPRVVNMISNRQMVHTDHTVGSNVRSYPMVRAMGDRSTTRGGGGGVRPKETATPMVAAMTSTSTTATRIKGLLFPDVRRGMVAVRCHHPKIANANVSTVLATITRP